MRIKKTFSIVIVLLSVLVVLETEYPAKAQVMSKWGHPVISFGWTPYDVIDQGHGNYPGSPGFIPGYGYYPGPGPGTYPWMDGPGTPFDRRKLLPALPFTPPGDTGLLVPLENEAPPPGAALIIVKVPAEAELWFDESKTSQEGSYRQFVTPPLPGSGNLCYSVRARWLIKGVELTREERVSVHPGGRETVNFLTVDHWTGRAIATLPMPAKIP
jgi:uncharacterized protein (TIGR03000 family)